MELISDARLLAEAMADEIVRTDDELRDLRTVEPVDLTPGMEVDPMDGHLILKIPGIRQPDGTIEPL